MGSIYFDFEHLKGNEKTALHLSFNSMTLSIHALHRGELEEDCRTEKRTEPFSEAVTSNNCEDGLRRSFILKRIPGADEVKEQVLEAVQTENVNTLS